MAGCAPPLLIDVQLLKTFTAARARRARKAHRCDNCGGAISAGQVYCDTGELKEAFSTYRYCKPCATTSDAQREARFRAKRARQRAAV